MSNFEINLGKSSQSNQTLLRVPVIYGDSQRQVSAILTNVSENSLPTVPAIAVYVSALNYDRQRVQEPQHVSKMQLRTRAQDPITGAYTEFQGQRLTVERLMPVPYQLQIKADIWTSNTDQKLQLLEQILVLFNPSLELQSSDSYVDWTSLSYITLNSTTFSSRTVPVGAEDSIDVANITFDLPVWLSAPAKVKRQGVIEKILADFYDPMGSIDWATGQFDTGTSVFLTRKIYTPIDMNVVLIDDQLKLYLSDNEEPFSDRIDPSLPVGDWNVAIRSFGELSGLGRGSDILKNGISQIRLQNHHSVVVGTVSYHPTDRSLLLFSVDIDTVPVNTMPPVTAIIDPQMLKITAQISFPAAGTRFLILNDIGDVSNNDQNPYTLDGAPVWDRLGYPTLVASANSIIEFTGSHWLVKFDSAAVGSQNVIHYVTNLTTGIQYKWQNQQWQKSVEGRYGVGSWSFVPN